MNPRPVVGAVFLLAALASSHPLHAMAGDSWKGFQPADRLGVIEGTTGCVAAAVARPPEVGQRASVYLWGRQGSGRFSMGVALDDLDGWLPVAALDPFRGPDVSPQAFRDEPVRIILRRGSEEFQSRARLVVVSTATLPEAVRGKAAESLVVNFVDSEGRHLGPTASAVLAAISRGFDSGEIRIAIGAGTATLHVRFDGTGVEPCAKALSGYIHGG